MALFYAAIRKHSVSLLKFHFLWHVQLFLCGIEISIQLFLFQIIIFLLIIKLSELFLVTLISLSLLFLMKSTSARYFPC